MVFLAFDNYGEKLRKKKEGGMGELLGVCVLGNLRVIHCDDSLSVSY